MRGTEKKELKKKKERERGTREEEGEKRGKG